MTEREYILATNVAKLAAARRILSEVMPGLEYGVPKDIGRIVAIAEQDTHLLLAKLKNGE